MNVHPLICWSFSHIHTRCSSCNTWAKFKMVLKKVDNRIRVLIENGVQKRQRSLFVVVGDKGKDQVSCTIFTRFLSTVVLVWFCSLSDFVYKTTYWLWYLILPLDSCILRFFGALKITAVFVLCDKCNICKGSRNPGPEYPILLLKLGWDIDDQCKEQLARNLSNFYLSFHAWCASLLSSWAQQITYVYLLYLHFH